MRASELSNGQQLILAVPLSDTYATLHHLLLIELAVTAGALVLAGLIGWPGWCISGCARSATSSAPRAPSPRASSSHGFPGAIARPRWAASPAPST